MKKPVFNILSFSSLTLVILLLIVSCKGDEEEPNALPTASFSISNESPEINEAISFTDESTDTDGEIVSWLWNFGNGDVSTEQNPIYTFTQAATYDVSLTVKDERDGEAEHSISLIVIDPVANNQAPMASFTVAETSVQKGTEVQFTDASTDSDGAIAEWAWDFGDGATSDIQSPSHFFSDTGLFTVTLTVTDNIGTTAVFDLELSIWGEKWSFASADQIASSSPAIADDGTIYFGSRDDNVYAINPDGTQKWLFATGGNISTSPTIGSDGTVFIGSDDDFVYALNPADGSQKWAFDTGGNPNNTSASLSADGSVLFVGASSDKLFAINTADGTEKWSYTADGDILSTVLGTNDMLYANHNGSRNLVAINANTGAELWSFNHGMFAGGSMAVDDANTVYFQGDGDNDFIYAINSDGTTKWSATLTGSASRGGVTIHNNQLYASTKEDTDHLKVLSLSDGSLIWSFTTEDDLSATPTVDNDGNVYFGSFDDKFYVLDSQGNLKFEFATGGNIWSSAAIGTDGTVYFGSYDGNLYAMEFFSPGLSGSTWPKLGKNLLNTNNK